MDEEKSVSKRSTLLTLKRVARFGEGRGHTGVIGLHGKEELRSDSHQRFDLIAGNSNA